MVEQSKIVAEIPAEEQTISEPTVEDSDIVVEGVETEEPAAEPVVEEAKKVVEEEKPFFDDGKNVWKTPDEMARSYRELQSFATRVQQENLQLKTPAPVARKPVDPEARKREVEEYVNDIASNGSDAIRPVAREVAREEARAIVQETLAQSKIEAAAMAQVQAIVADNKDLFKDPDFSAAYASYLDSPIGEGFYKKDSSNFALELLEHTKLKLKKSAPTPPNKSGSEPKGMIPKAKGKTYTMTKQEVSLANLAGMTNAEWVRAREKKDKDDGQF